MKSYKLLILCLVLQFNASCVLLGQNEYPEAKVIVTVLDDDGKPVPDADVTIGFQPYGGYSKWQVKGKSNKKGIFTGENKTGSGVWFSAEKNGYYEGSAGIRFKQQNKLLNRWEPYPSKITIKLRKKKNPVPMYVGNIEGIKIPVIGEPIGFDLEKGDWVKPHGKGEVADFIILYKGQRKLKDRWNAEASLTLTFSNPFDGIKLYTVSDNFQNSQYSWPYNAPLNDFQNSIFRFIKFIENKGSKSNMKNKKTCKYIFRVRTKTDKEGQIISANYGKIVGEFNISYRGTISFTYYFNPDPKSRSLEFDPKKNLFKSDKTFNP